jgi:hypothetical protein
MFYGIQKCRFFYRSLCVLPLLILYHGPLDALSSLDKNDAYPVFSNWYEHEYMLTKKLFLAEHEEWAEERGERFTISVNGFFQNANRGKSMVAVPRIVPPATAPPSVDTHLIELLDLTGESAMIPLLFGSFPQGITTLPPLLTTAFNALYPGLTQGTINFGQDIDPEQLFGFFSLPAIYKKSGIRFDMELDLICDVGFHLQGGFSSICQVGKTPLNLTCQTLDPCYFVPGPATGEPVPTVSNPVTITVDDINKYLMDGNKFECIMKEMGYDIANFQKTSAEEIRLQLYWRHAYPLNTKRSDWPQMHVIPYVEGGASFSPGMGRDTSELYGLAFGNNKHTACGFTTGVDLNFIGTIQIGGAFGFTHFFAHDFDCFRLPNSKLQSNLFPFTTSVRVQPGNNLHFEGSLIARHFLDNLSMFFQYINLQHQEDCISVCNDDPAFVPGALAKTTGFKTKLANIGFIYDFTPNFSVGFLWQAPMAQHNSYRSTTIMFGVNGVF